MTDTHETLKAALADLTARVAAFEKARVEEEEPPLCRNAFYLLLCDIQQGRNVGVSTKNRAMREWDRMERELARLREGLRRQEGEMPDRTLSDYMDNPERVPVFGAVTYRSECVRMAREIQRHRKLVAK